MTPNKACPVVVRSTPPGVEILMFRHPRAGCQLVKGSIEPGESPPRAAVRELFEEAGVVGARVVRDLGEWEAIPGEQRWSLQLCEPRAPLPDHWTHHCADDGGHTFTFFWQPLAAAPPDTHPLFLEALTFIRTRL